MPSSAIVSGTQKIIHFYEAPDIPMLFDLATDEGEVKNIAPLKPTEHDKLYNEMMRYFNEMGARIPKKNSNYDPDFYKKAKEYNSRVM